uniref:Ariadne RBR E3 ubiquitin protein ligase 2 n=1 Tax=Canis lupus familiaris TaxID=9615 RepID=A0A8I3QLY2_CANLF
MSVDMNSQGSDSNEEDYDPNCEEEEEDEDPGDIEDYYVGVASDVEQQGADAFDPEEYQFTCLTYKESEGALKSNMQLSLWISPTPSLHPPIVSKDH